MNDYVIHELKRNVSLLLKNSKMTRHQVLTACQQNCTSFFWPEVCTEMIGSFNYAFQSGALSISQKRGIISLIPKKR